MYKQRLNEPKNTKSESLAMLYMEHQDLAGLTPTDIAEKFEAAVHEIDNFYDNKEKELESKKFAEYKEKFPNLI